MLAAAAMLAACGAKRFNVPQAPITAGDGATHRLSLIAASSPSRAQHGSFCSANSQAELTLAESQRDLNLPFRFRAMGLGSCVSGELLAVSSVHLHLVLFAAVWASVDRSPATCSQHRAGNCDFHALRPCPKVSCRA